MAAPDQGSTVPEEVDAILDRFHQDWQRGTRPNLKEFLRRHVGHPASRILAFRLIKIDVEHRLLAGDQAPFVEDYSEGLDEIAFGDEEWKQLFRLEYEGRWRRGEIGIRRKTYQQRHPRLAQAIENWRPRWTCPRCSRESIPLAEEDVATAACPRCQSTFAVAELFVPAAREVGGLDLRNYERLADIGKGGMGEVYRSRDPALRRDLAIKVIHPSLRGQRQSERRFLEEARIAGRLEHPAIVPIYNLGRLPDGRLFYTMKLVEGQTLHDLLHPADRPRPGQVPPDFITSFGQVCQALAFAHENGVIHRDLKPSNIMVGRFGEVQVMDWGLAKDLRAGPGAADTDALAGTAELLQAVRAGGQPLFSTLHTREGQRLGTLLYMPPEQAMGRRDAVGKPADVFALGAILCEILTGYPPYREADERWLDDHHPDPDERARHNAELAGRWLERAEKGDTGPGLRRLAAGSADSSLVQIAQDCLASDWGQRPKDAGEVAQRTTKYQADIRQRAEEEKVQRAKRAEAEKRAAAERRVRRGAVVLAGVVFVALVGAVIASVYFDRLAGENRQLFESEQTARGEATNRLERLFAQNGTQALRVHDPHGALPWFAESMALCQGNANREPVQRVRLATTLHSTPRLVSVWFVSGPVWDVGFSPDGRQALALSGPSSSNKPALHVWHLADGKPLFAPLPVHEGASQVTCTANNRWIIASANPGFGRRLDQGPNVGLWDARDGKPLLSGTMPKELCGCAVADAEGRLLLTGPVHDGGENPFHVLWRIAPDGLTRLRTIRGEHAALTPDGKALVIVELSSKKELTAVVRWLDIESGKETRSLNLGALGMIVPKFHLNRDASRLFVVHGEVPLGIAPLPAVPSVTLWDLRTGMPDPGLDQVTMKVEQAAFHPDEERVLLANFWSNARPVPVPGLSEDEGRATAPVDAVEIWHLGKGRVAGPFQHSQVRRVDLIDFQTSPDGGLVATAGQDGLVRLWPTSGRRHPVTLHAGAKLGAIAFSPDSRYLVTGDESGAIRVWDLTSGPETLDIPFVQADPRESIRISPDGGRLLSLEQDDGAELWDGSSGRRLASLSTRQPGTGILTFSENGERIALALQDQTAQVFSVSTGTPIFTSPRHDLPIRDITFSPDGNRLVTTTGKSGIVPRIMITTRQIVSPFLRREAKKGEMDQETQGEVSGWDLASGSPLWKQPLLHQGPIVKAEFSRDGRRLATASNDHSARVWDAATGQPLTPPLKHSGVVWLARFSGSGKYLLTAAQPLRPGTENQYWNLDDAGEVQVWDTSTGKSVLPAPIRHSSWIMDAAFSPDERRIATASLDSTARIWDARDGKPKIPPLPHPDYVWIVRFSPDGGFVATGCQDGGVRIWDAATGDAVCPDLMTGHPIIDLRILSDQQVMAVNTRGLCARLPLRDRSGRSVAEWRSIAHAHAYAHLDETGSYVGLEPNALHGFNLPNRPVALSEREWHRRAGGYFLANNDTFAAGWHFDRLIEMGDKDPWIRVRRARAGMAANRLSAAAADLAAATQGGVEHLEVLLVYAAAGWFSDEPARYYRDACQRLVARYGRSSNPAVASEVVMICTLGPDAVGDPKAVVKLADSISPGDQRAFARGAALYRAGQFGDAVEELGRTSPMFRSEHLEVFLYLAMANHRLGKKAEAKRWFDDFEKNQPLSPEPGIHVSVLLRETENVLGIKAP